MTALRVVAGSVGIAGHALPALALASELRRRGHDVTYHGYERWRALAEAEGLRFVGARSGLTTGADAETGIAEATRGLLRAFEATAPDVVVSDALTLTPALAAEVAGVPRALLLPEVYPDGAPGMPPFALGLRAPRTALGALGWRVLGPTLRTRLPSNRWLVAARAALNREREALGLDPVAAGSTPVSEALTLVATFPQLEYPRRWPTGVHVTGPMAFEPGHAEIPLPTGQGPLVLVAPSTVKDRRGRLAAIALEALADEPVRVVVTTSGGPAPAASSLPANAVVAQWVDYRQMMAAASLVVCHGNHGTVAAALAAGTPLAISPVMPDDAEHGARVAWAGAGLMVPAPLLSPGTLRMTGRRVLADARFTARAAEIARWAESHSGPARGAELVEAHAHEAASRTRP